ncbi:MAG: hypothetical protein ACI8XW_001221 [Gammaproteobacteria bacterium]|jgi:hypothetical protein
MTDAICPGELLIDFLLTVSGMDRIETPMFQKSVPFLPCPTTNKYSSFSMRTNNQSTQLRWPKI